MLKYEDTNLLDDEDLDTLFERTEDDLYQYRIGYNRVALNLISNIDNELIEALFESANKYRNACKRKHNLSEEKNALVSFANTVERIGSYLENLCLVD